jgi:hypothetical protein
MSHFYRYIRPLVFVEKRTEIETNSRGGICLRFEHCKDGLSFTHSRCHPLELFSKTVAKRVATHRAIHWSKGINLLVVQETNDNDALIKSVITEAKIWSPTWVDQAYQIMAKYIKMELIELSNSLEQIMHNNETEMLKAKVWAAGLEAIRIKEQYSAHSN